MYQVGENVVYGIHGVCRVVEEEERLVDRKKMTYLALEPLGQNGARFLVPTQSPAAMAKLHRMLSKAELEALLRSDEVRADSWIKDENLRKQTYRTLINSGDRAKLIGMVHTLYRHKESQAAAGRKFHLCDENFLRDAEKLINSEVSIVLNMESDQVRKYIRDRLNEEV